MDVMDVMDVMCEAAKAPHLVRLTKKTGEGRMQRGRSSSIAVFIAVVIAAATAAVQSSRSLWLFCCALHVTSNLSQTTVYYYYVGVYIMAFLGILLVCIMMAPEVTTIYHRIARNTTKTYLVVCICFGDR